MGKRPIPPDDQRCRGVYKPTYKGDPAKIGQRCEQKATRGEYCYKHCELPDEERCTGHYASTNKDGKGGQRCVMPRMRGQNVCGLHGGRTRQSRAAAERRRAEEKARQLVETYGRKVTTTATEALLEEVQWTAGHVAWLRERVREIETRALGDGRENPLVWGVVRRKEGGDDYGVTEEAAPNIWLKLYQTERAHLVRVCAEAIKAGIEERRVKLAEQQGQLVAQAIRAILDDLGLSAEQQAKVPEIVPRHLRALAS